MAKKIHKKKGTVKPKSLPVMPEDNVEIENLMRHDAFRRSSGAVRQIIHPR